jgi:DNA-binding transcriptional regulator YiaG
MKKMFHYTACGLDNVWLESGFVSKETKYGPAFAVQDADQLHKLLAIKLIDKPCRLAGQEFRFLRTQLGLSQESLAKLFDVSENAVSLWERKNAVPVTCDKWLRVCVLVKFAGKTKLSDAIERIKTVHQLVYQKYVVKDVDGRRSVSVVKQPDAEKVLTPA